ncbi:MAG: VWA domain-containing protein [Dehalococcoidia bacterium]|nr:VWA domain-containing protein [Dehalococcoidia bacterium]
MNALLDLFVWPFALCALVAVSAASYIGRYEARRRLAARLALGGPDAGARRGLEHFAGAALLIGAIVLAALAFARPRWGAEDIPLEQRGIDVVIVLDVSRSMLAQDIAPSRAQASSAAVSELLTHLQGNRVGLVTFAGSSFPRSPLTLDIRAVRTLVERAQSESSLVRAGSDLGGAVDAALSVLDVEDRATTQAILVVTDGEVQQADITAVKAAASSARAQQVRIFGAFAATEEPVALPASSGGIDLTRGQRGPLSALADLTGGAVLEVAQVPGLAVEFHRLQQTRFEESSRHATVERFQWFAGGALTLIVLQQLLPRAANSRIQQRSRRLTLRRSKGARSATLTMLSLVALLLSGCTSSLIGTPVYRAVAEGNRLYAEGKYEEALAAYDRATEKEPSNPAIAYNRSLALHHLTRYAEAYRAIVATRNEASDVSLVGRMEFSAGNSAFLLEQWVDARDRYTAALRLDPTDAVAKANLELVLARTNLRPQPNGGDSETPPGNGEQNQQPNGQPGVAPQQGQGPGGGQPTGQLQPGDGQPGQTAQPGNESVAAPSTLTQAEAQAALEAALAALGPEVSRNQALRILELARQANATDQGRRTLPQGGQPPPR